MSLDRLVFVFAGVLILFSLVMSQLHSVYWLWFTAFIGLNMTQAAFTGFCPAAIVFKLFGAKPGKAFK
jgi:hypothetical protein